MLTAEQIMTLNRVDLDYAVGEHFLGWRWWRSSRTGRRCLYAHGKNPEWMRTPADGTEPLAGDWYDAWPGSMPVGGLSWAGAGMLLEKAAGRGWVLFVGRDATTAGGWVVQFKRQGENVHHWARGGTGPEAVARAILLLTTGA